MKISDWIAIAAFLLALASWIDSRARIAKTDRLQRREAIRFALEVVSSTPDKIRVRLRNIGTRTAVGVKVDGASLEYWRYTPPLIAFSMEPGDSGAVFTIWYSDGELPDTIRVVWSDSPAGSQLVRVPDAPDRGES